MMSSEAFHGGGREQYTWIKRLGSFMLDGLMAMHRTAIQSIEARDAANVRQAHDLDDLDALMRVQSPEELRALVYRQSDQ